MKKSNPRVTPGSKSGGKGEAKELLSNARMVSEFVRTEFIRLDGEGQVGVCVIMPVPKAIYRALQMLPTFDPDVMRDIEDEVYTAYKRAVGKYIMVVVEEASSHGSTLQ